MNEGDAIARIKQMTTFVQEEAKERAREIEAKTEHEYNLAKTKHLHQAKERLQADYDKKWKQLEVRRRINKSTAINAARMEIMEARNDCINQLLDAAKFELQDRMQSDQGAYEELVRKLIVEGLIKLLEPKVKIRCRREDENLVQGVLSDAKREYQEMMQKETGNQYNLEISMDTSEYLPPKPERGSNAASCSGGVILLTNEGKTRCINTLDARLRLTFENCIPLVRSYLFPK